MTLRHSFDFKLAVTSSHILLDLNKLKIKLGIWEYFHSFPDCCYGKNCDARLVLVHVHIFTLNDSFLLYFKL